MLGGEDTDTWSATKGGIPIPATIPVDFFSFSIRYHGSSSSINCHVYHYVEVRRHAPVVCNERREPHTSHYPSNKNNKQQTTHTSHYRSRLVEFF